MIQLYNKLIQAKEIIIIKEKRRYYKSSLIGDLIN
jgi:hypothetical protein